jgi:hypothetical protein
MANGDEPLSFAYRVRNASSGLVVGGISQRAQWNIDGKVMLAKHTQRIRQQIAARIVALQEIGVDLVSTECMHMQAEVASFGKRGQPQVRRREAVRVCKAA